jgi:PilZ domain-containing protein
MVDERWGPTDVADPASEDAPVAGSVVGLMLAQAQGRPSAGAGSGPYAATLQDWQSEPGGLTVVAEVSADPSTVRAVSGQNVWGSFFTPTHALIVMAALARERLGSDDDRIELTGVRMLAYEPRRRSLRAGLNRPVRLFSGSGAHRATTLDLSRGGCRVMTEDPGDPLDPGAPGNISEGYALAVSVELDDGLVLETDALVVRADGPELALRFTGLAATEEAELDAAVFRELVRSES